MMKLYRFIGLGLLCMAAACSKDSDFVEVEQDLGYPVLLSNSISQVTVTRVNDEGFCDGDGVGIYVVNYDNNRPGQLQTEGNQADNVQYVYHEADNKWVPDIPVYFKDKKTHVDIIGYYPYGTPSSVEACDFEVAKDQSTDAANGLLGGYEASDFLWGKASDIAPTTQKTVITFKHRMAGVAVTLAEGTGFADGEFVGLEKALLVTNTIRKASVNLSTGEMTPVGDVPATGIVPYRRGEDFRAVVVPQTVPAATPLFSITVDGTAYVYRKQEAFPYIGGKLHKFTIEVSKKSDSGLEFKLLGESITAWENDNISHDATAREYVIVDCPTAGTLKECITAAGKDYSKVVNLKVTGKINSADFYTMREDMPALQAINLKEANVKGNEIPDYAFEGKSTLTRFVFPQNITAIGQHAFHNTNLSGPLILPNGITLLGSQCFYECKGLSSLILPQSLEYIGDHAFCDCTNLSGTLNIPESVTCIGNYTFHTCKFTGNLILPKNLGYLGVGAFSGSSFTGNLTVPEKIKTIKEYTFMGCSGLNGILTLPKNLVTIESSAFSSCGFRGTLALPETLIVIGNNAFYGNKFSGNLVLPKNLEVMGSAAFSGCQRLTGVVEIPDNIVSIPENTFANCRQLEGVVLPKGIESVQSGAFRDCFQLNAITSKAQTPPRIDADAFAGVAKDNFTVEVPEEAVADYITAPGWREFKRFAAHREFSVSRNLFRALNAPLSKTVVMRAPSGASWSVESKPDWVKVEPMNGVGKQEVTLSVDALVKGAGQRSGEVVFLLDGKDYRSRTTVEQYDYEYGDGDVLTSSRATKGAGVNLVFMGDCFDAKDIAEGKYLKGVNEAIGHFFAIEPYKSYKEYFNVYTVFGLSPDSGIGDVNTIRESKFGSAYALGDITPDETVCFEYACKAPTVTADNVNKTLVTLIENTADYGGITYMWGDGSAIAVCPMSEDLYPYDFRGVVQHEAGGHGFGKLADEYIYHNAFIQTCTCLCCEHIDGFNAYKNLGWYANLSLSGNMYDVPWSHLIFDPQYSDVVDVYEGGFFHTRGVFRSEPNSCMNNNIPYYSAISRETMVKRIMEYAGEPYSFEEFKARDVMLPSAADTRSLPSMLEYTASNKQHGPVFMGDRPQLKK